MIWHRFALIIRHRAAQSTIAQQCMHRGRVKRAGHPVVLPIYNWPHRAGAVIERVGVLDKGGIMRGLFKAIHKRDEDAVVLVNASLGA